MSETDDQGAQPRATGQTERSGFQIGVRRTLPIPIEAAWRRVTSPEGVRRWLGDTADLRLRPGAGYRLAEGGGGEVRVVRLNDHLRITWQPAGWARASTIQVRVIAKGGASTTIAFHQEHLPSADERERRRAHFEAVLQELGREARE